MKQHEKLLEQAKLNWTVTKRPLQTTDGIPVPTRMALIREDTKAVLGVCGVKYEMYQNSELMELLFKVSQKTGLALHSGGMFDGGGKVWVQLKSDDLILPNDKIEGYVSGFNSFDMSASLAFGNSFNTVSCRNTFWKVYSQVESRFRHSASMRPKLEELLKRLEQVLLEEKATFEEIKKLQDFRMDDATETMVLAKLFDLNQEEMLESIEDLSTFKLNKIEQFTLDLAQEVAQKGDNLWGLFSGVTRYTTHSMKNGKDNTESKMFGTAGMKEKAIYKSLVELVSA